MGSLFSRKENKPQAVGGIPGWGNQAQNAVTSLYDIWQHPEQTPGYSVLSGYTSGPFAQQAQALQQSYLSPDFLTKTNPALQGLYDTWTKQNETNKSDALANAVMKFGSAGQLVSSPMLQSFGRVQEAYDTDLANRIGQSQVDQYNRNQAIQAATAGIPLQAAGQQQGMWSQLLAQYLQALGMGRPQYQQASYQPSLFDQLLGAGAQVASAYYGV